MSFGIDLHLEVVDLDLDCVSVRVHGDVELVRVERHEGCVAIVDFSLIGTLALGDFRDIDVLELAHDLRNDDGLDLVDDDAFHHYIHCWWVGSLREDQSQQAQ